MNYEIVTLEAKTLVGLKARTGNEDPNCLPIIGGLWQKFMEKDFVQSIKNISSPFAYCLYSDYDPTSYDVTIGMCVSKAENPELTTKLIPAGKYAKFFVKGDVVKDVGEAWEEIWKMPLERTYTADFEEYLNNDNGNAEINIYIALK